jgi:3-hydroxyacyl-[acyl-carrier-protein] dehydratase
MLISEAIPHRPPFLFVDEVLACDGKTIKTRKRIDPAEIFFKGHFPGSPVMPGVLLCEALAQSGAILLAQLQPALAKGALPVLTRMNNVKFKQMVKPGDMLEMEVSLKEKLAGVYFMEAAARVNGKLAVTLDFACTLVKAESGA